MSKVTIKFWNTEKREYVDDWRWFVVDSLGDIKEIKEACYSNDLVVSSIDSGLEAHYFKDEERIA